MERDKTTHHNHGTVELTDVRLDGDSNPKINFATTRQPTTDAALTTVQPEDLPIKLSKDLSKIPDSELSLAELLEKYPKSKELEQDDKDRNIEERASCLGYFMFTFVQPLISLGYRRPLTADDIPKISKARSSLLAAPILERAWEQVKTEHTASHRKALAKAQKKGLPASSVRHTDPSFPKAIWRTLGGYAIVLTILQLALRVEQTFEPIILEKILLWLARPTDEEKWGYIYGAILLVMTLCQTFINNYFFHLGFQLYTRMRSAVCALVYTKAMKITVLEEKPEGKGNAASPGAPGAPASSDAKSPAGGPAGQGPKGLGKDSDKSGTSAMSTGQIVNLMSVDADKIGMMCFLGWSSIFVPVQIAVSLWLLYDTIGASMFVGFGVIFVLVPVVFLLVLRTSRSTQGRMAISDRRVKLTNELLQGIRIVKFYAWEYFFQRELTRIRDEELVQIFRTNLFSGLTLFVFSVMVNIFSVAVFLVYSYVQDSFNAATVFKAVAYVNSLQAPLFQLPNSIATILMGLISARRVQSFLVQPEVDSMKAITAIQPLAYRKHQRRLLEAEAKARGVVLPYDSVADANLEGFDTDNYDPSALVNFDSLENPSDPTNDVELNKCSFTWKSVTNEIGDPDVIENGNVSSPSNAGNVVVEMSPVAIRYAVLGAPVPKYLRDITPSQQARLRKIPVVLKDIDFKAMKGKLTAIVGPVGSGKSSLLAGILGEIDVVYGTVARTKSARLAYVAQSAWIQTKNIRDNITFGEELDTPESIARYNRTLDVCALRPDLAALDAGDDTEIGDRGINLSGGQKQRVAIARAVFADADIYLFDDPLSAVDAHVAEHIFADCIEGALAGKTRILVMNQLHFLPRCDYIYVLGTEIERRRDYEEMPAASDAPQESEESKQSTVGIIAEHGTYASLSSTGEQFKALMQNYRESLEKKGGDESEEETEEKEAGAEDTLLPVEPTDVVLGEMAAAAPLNPVVDLNATALEPTEAAGAAGVSVVFHNPAGSDGLKRNPSYSVNESRTRSRIKGSDRKVSYSVSRSSKHKVSEPVEAKEQPTREYYGGGALKKGQQIQEEELATGSVALTMYWRFFKAMGKFNFFMLVLVSCIAQTAVSWLGLMLGYWADRRWDKSMEWYRTMYAIILCIVVVFMFLRSWFFARCTATASSNFHGGVLDRVLRASSGFFDVTPAGRILNRFSKDLDAIDTLIPQTLLHTISLALQLLATVCTCAALYPWFTIALVVIAIAFYFLQTFYSPAAIQVQRIESNTRSPMFQHFSESLKGIATIRAFNRVPQFQIENFNRIDTNSASLYWVRMIYRWGGLRVGFLQCLLILTSILLVVVTRGDMDVGMAGVVLTYMLAVSGLVGFLVMMSIELAGRMNAVERLQHYSETVPQEASLDDGVDEFRPPEAWPSKGVIEYRNVEMAYRPDLPPVIHNLSFLIESKKKVGVVGRTGSGKSSLMMLLLRLYEIQKGKIFIDGVDISQLSLHDLRKKIGIVPQDPVLFSGTLRSNLDPFNEYTDEQIMESLEAVNLDSYVKRLPGELDAPVQEFGANFSQGQRQLLCLSRVLLKKPKILLLDEATSSVDSETDSLLQRAIVEKFGDATQLTIAHRLNTVMNSDRILVLEKGDLAEFDSPAELVKEPTPESQAEPKTLTRVPGKGIFADMYKAYIEHNN